MPEELQVVPQSVQTIGSSRSKYRPATTSKLSLLHSQARYGSINHLVVA